MGEEITSSGRVIQNFIIKLGSSQAEQEEKTTGRRGSPSIGRAAPSTEPQEPNVEVVISEHVDPKTPRTRGRHVG